MVSSGICDVVITSSNVYSEKTSLKKLMMMRIMMMMVMIIIIIINRKKRRFDIAGRQYPQPDSQVALQNICHAVWGEILRCRSFSSWKGGITNVQAHIKMRHLRNGCCCYWYCFFKMVEVCLRMCHRWLKFKIWLNQNGWGI